MSLTIELSPYEERRLAAAAEQRGIHPTELVRRLVTDHLPDISEGSTDPTLALFAKWDEEDSRMTPEEVAEENATWEQMKANINAERERAGARPVF